MPWQLASKKSWIRATVGATPPGMSLSTFSTCSTGDVEWQYGEGSTGVQYGCGGSTVSAVQQMCWWGAAVYCTVAVQCETTTKAAAAAGTTSSEGAAHACRLLNNWVTSDYFQPAH